MLARYVTAIQMDQLYEGMHDVNLSLAAAVAATNPAGIPRLVAAEDYRNGDRRNDQQPSMHGDAGLMARREYLAPLWRDHCGEKC